MFPIETINCPELELESVVLPKLRGSVFHVTNTAGLKGIRKDKLIRNNKDGKFPFTWGQSAHNYGINRGCICLWDLRNITNKQLKNALEEYPFLNPPSAENKPIYLFISEGLFPELISHMEARAERAKLKDAKVWKEIWVPNAEAWFRGNIPIDNISRGVRVHVKRAHSPHRDMLEKIENSLKTRSGH